MNSYEELEQIVTESGLWTNGDNYLFELSPSVYEITTQQERELEKLGAALYDTLAGLGKIRAISLNPGLAHGDSWGMIDKALRIGIPSHYHDLAKVKPGQTPAILKVDLLEGVDGRFYIAEIDGHNKHGFGYSTLAVRMRDLIEPGAKVFPGVAKKIADVLAGRSLDVTLLYADQERFYLPEFNILAEELARHGIETMVIAESDVKNEGFTKDHGFFVDLPVMYHNRRLNDEFSKAYRDSEVSFLIPPKPFLGSKAVLAILRNEEGNDQLEGILRSQIPLVSLELVREYIPRTYLVDKRKRKGYYLDLCQNQTFVLKETISGSMKGTVFVDDKDFEKLLERALGSIYGYVLQEEVRTLSRPFLFFNEEREIEEDQWYSRVTVHFCQRTVADIVVTARRDKRVHGAPDCLQLGTVIT